MKVNRREFLWQLFAGIGSAAVSGCRTFDRDCAILPVKTVPSYWCTWCREVAMAADKGRRTKILYPGDQGTVGARDTIDERSLFGSEGWARYYPRERGNLLLVIDDGWDVPYGLDPWGKDDMSAFGSLEPDAQRFPSLGRTPSERLKGLVERTKDCGWKGLGIWVACQCPGETRTSQYGSGRVDEWLKRKLDESARAGITYWKVDWGVRDRDASYRARMTELKRRYYPELVIEHMPFHSEPILPADFTQMVDCPFNRTMIEISDVIRTYDVQPPLNQSVTLRRVAEYSRMIDRAGSSTALNVEDEVVIGAVLNHAIGIMRAPDARAAETRAAVAWQRIAPSVAARPGLVTRCSSDSLSEMHAFGKDEAWFAPANGKTLVQHAPAIMARGMALPNVRRASGERPFVVAARHPNGSLAVAQLFRQVDGKSTSGVVEIELNAELRSGRQLAVFGSPHLVRVRVKGRTEDLRLRNLSTDEELPFRVSAARDGILELFGKDYPGCVAIAVTCRATGRMKS